MLSVRRCLGSFVRTMSKVVGISGVTNGGKTTLCVELLQELRRKDICVTHLNMDDYYWDEDSTHHALLKDFNNHADWDDVCAVDWVSLINTIKEWKAASTPTEGSARLLLVEGIMIFNQRDMLHYFDKMYFITLPYDECWKRRQTRTYIPPDPEGYFDKVVWSHYLKFKDEVAKIPGITQLDGQLTQEENFRHTLEGILELLQQK